MRRVYRTFAMRVRISVAHELSCWPFDPVGDLARVRVDGGSATERWVLSCGTFDTCGA